MKSIYLEPYIYPQVTVLERCGYFTLTSNLPFTLSRWFSTGKPLLSRFKSEMYPITLLSWAKALASGRDSVKY